MNSLSTSKDCQLSEVVLISGIIPFEEKCDKSEDGLVLMMSLVDNLSNHHILNSVKIVTDTVMLG